MGRGLWEPVWSRRQTAWGAFLLMALAFGLYARTFGNEFFNWDDGIYVVENPLIRQMDGASVRAIFSHTYFGLYLPLVLMSYGVDYVLWPKLLGWVGPTDPLGYHLQNVLWFTATIPVIFFLARRLTQHAGASWWVTALFVVHPVHVESVAWVAERKDVVFGFFFFASLLAYARYRQEDQARWYGISLLLFAASCGAKVTAVILPVVLVMLDWRWGRSFWTRRFWLEKAPFFALSLLVGLVTTAALQNVVRQDLSGLERLTIASNGFGYYLVRSFWPFHLAVFYPMALRVGELSAAELIFPLLLGGIAGLLLLRSGQGRMLALCGGIFVVNLLPVLQLVPTATHLITERYLYVSSFAVCLGLGGILLAAGSLPRKGLQPCLLVVFLAGLTAVWAGQTLHRVRVWQTSLSLWKDAVAKYPSDWAYYHLGRTYHEARDGAGAEAAWKSGLALNPTADDLLFQLQTFYREQGRSSEAEKMVSPSSTHLFHNGVAPMEVQAQELEKAGRLEEALRLHQDILRLQPDWLASWEALGGLSLRLHQPKEALQSYRYVLNRQPNNSSAWTNTGKAYLQLQQRPEALDAFRKALQYKPTHAVARQNAVELLMADGKMTEAQELLVEGVALSPESPVLQYLLGTFFLQQNHLEEAIHHLQQSIALSRQMPNSYMNLGVAYASKGEVEKAITTYQRGLTLTPQHPGLWANLAVALETQNRREEALAAWEKAVQCDPKNLNFQNRLQKLKTPTPLEK